MPRISGHSRGNSVVLHCFGPHITKVCTEKAPSTSQYKHSPSLVASPHRAFTARRSQVGRAAADSAELRGLPETRREFPRRLQTRVFGCRNLVFRADFSTKKKGEKKSLVSGRAEGSVSPGICVPARGAGGVPERVGASPKRIAAGRPQSPSEGSGTRRGTQRPTHGEGEPRLLHGSGESRRPGQLSSLQDARAAEACGTLRRWAVEDRPHPAGARPPRAPIALTCRCPRGSLGRSTCVPAPGAAAADPGSGPAAPGPLLPGTEEVAAPSGKLPAPSRLRSSLPARRSGSSAAPLFLSPAGGARERGRLHHLYKAQGL